jgi:ring-1,2-phenylacetyl-CoA epoxidase subunit PaaD
MVTMMNREGILTLLSSIPDPEIPTVNIIEMGILREVEFHPSDGFIVTITPTYSGCPAMKAIEDDIHSLLSQHCREKFTIVTKLSPAWTTDWLSDIAREKLRMSGITPPVKGTADKNSILGEMRMVKCPRCGGSDTHMLSQFGSTACKALYRCAACSEPFDYFKCI